MKKFFAMLLALAMLLGLAACGGGEAAKTPAPTGGAQTPAPTSTAGEDPGSPLKIALLLSGTINDGSYNQQIYDSVKSIESKYDIEYAYTESIVLADMQAVVQDYCDKGYELIIANGYDFNDAIMACSAEFPDVDFAVIGGSDCNGSNVASYRHYTPHVGFLAGALAAMKSETGTVCTFAGMSFPHVVDNVTAFEAGAKYIDPNVNVITGYIESWTDSAKAKEMTAAAIEQNADVVYCSANAAALGAYEAIDEANAAGKAVVAIGATSDMYDTAPNIMMVSIIQSQGALAVDVIEDVINGDFSGDVRVVGIESDSVALSDWHGHDSWLTADELAKVDEIIAGLSDYSLVEQGICPKSCYDT